ncbi:MAG: DUF2892 domain-containing protein [Acetobacteraceae bacterium]
MIEMVTNIGDTDRFIRFAIGIALVVLGITGKLGWLGLIIGIVLVATAYKRFCPAYKYFGYNTLQNKLQKSS